MEGVERLASALTAKGVIRGTKVALLLRNCPEYVIADLAILKLGAVKVPLNELLSPDETDYCLNHSGAKAIVVHASLYRPKLAYLTAIVVPEVGHDSPTGTVNWTDALNNAPAPVADAAWQADDDVIISYTGGTTGRPKGVRHLQGRMAINLLAHITCGEISATDILQLMTPLPHSAGYHLEAGLFQGCRIILQGRFSPDDFAQACFQTGATWTFMVPTMIYRLLDHVAGDPARIQSLRTVLYGAAPMSRARLEQAIDLLGPIFIQIFGQTECPNFITTLGKTDHLNADLLSSCGRPVPYVNVGITQQDANSSVGEVRVQSGYLLADYYLDPEITAASFDGPWLMTGDIGYFNSEGFLFLVDRAKDMIITGGMNVYSIEVEDAIRRHQSVRDAAVVGLPDDDWGERVTAFVVRAENVTATELLAHCKATLSAYRVPKEIRFVDELPLTAYGKIDKKRIRANASSTAIASAG